MSDRMLVVPSLTLSPLCTDVPVPTEGQPEWWRVEGRHGRFSKSALLAVGYTELGPSDGVYPHPVAVWQEVDGTLLTLQRHQANPNVHPYTCENRGDGKHRTTRDLGVLTPTLDGWVCKDCDYTQPFHGWGKGVMVGAVTAIVEVTGPGHHADECCPDKGQGYDGIHGLGCGCNESWRCSGKPLTPEGQSTAGEHCECWDSGDVNGGYVCCRCGEGSICGAVIARSGWHTPTGVVTPLDVPIPMERPTVCGGHRYPRPGCRDKPAGSWWADINMEDTDGR